MEITRQIDLRRPEKPGARDSNIRRRRSANLVSAAILLLPLAACMPVLAQIEATVQVDASKVRHAIPRTIYGTFLEPIGHSIYGGLWAQILENPSFEDNLWGAGRIRQMVTERPELQQAPTSGCRFPGSRSIPRKARAYEPRWGDAANSTRSLLIMALPGKQTGVRQQVYLPVHRELRYTGSLWAKPVSGPKELEVSLRRRNHPENVLAKAVVRITGSGWTRYEFALELEKGALASREPADFVVAASDEERVLLDQVFLFPADNVDGMNPEMIAMTKRAAHAGGPLRRQLHLRLPLARRHGPHGEARYHAQPVVGHAGIQPLRHGRVSALLPSSSAPSRRWR